MLLKINQVTSIYSHFISIVFIVGTVLLKETTQDSLILIMLAIWVVFFIVGLICDTVYSQMAYFLDDDDEKNQKVFDEFPTIITSFDYLALSIILLIPFLKSYYILVLGAYILFLLYKTVIFSKLIPFEYWLVFNHKSLRYQLLFYYTFKKEPDYQVYLSTKKAIKRQKLLKADKVKILEQLEFAFKDNFLKGFVRNFDEQYSSKLVVNQNSPVEIEKSKELQKDILEALNNLNKR